LPFTEIDVVRHPLVRRSSRRMSGSRSDPRDNRRSGTGVAAPAVRPAARLSVASAAAFAVLFYLWGHELLLAPREGGGTFPFVGCRGLTLAVALFLTEWFGSRGGSAQGTPGAARFLFLCSLAFLLFFAAKG